MTITIEYLGFAGMTLSILAYLPQIIHLIKEQCSWGVSESAYVTWATASMLLLTYSICMKDTVFIALQSYQLVSNVLICFFCRKYRDSLCDEHGSELSDQLFTPAVESAELMSEGHVSANPGTPCNLHGRTQQNVSAKLRNLPKQIHSDLQSNNT